MFRDILCKVLDQQYILVHSLQKKPPQQNDYAEYGCSKDSQWFKKNRISCVLLLLLIIITTIIIYVTDIWNGTFHFMPIHIITTFH